MEPFPRCRADVALMPLRPFHFNGLDLIRTRTAEGRSRAPPGDPTAAPAWAETGRQAVPAAVTADKARAPRRSDAQPARRVKIIADGTESAGRTEFAQDSSLEGDGFEPSVPRNRT